MPSHPTIFKLGKVTAPKKPSPVLKMGKVIAKDGTIPLAASATTDTPAIPAASGVPATPAAQVTRGVMESGAPAKKTVLEDDSETPVAPPVDKKSPVSEKEHYDLFAPSSDPSDPFEPERVRIRLALLQWRTRWKKPRTRSSASWAAEKDNYAEYIDKADDVNEKQYWMARSIKAEMYAQGRYKAGRRCDKNIRFGVHMWKRSFLDRQNGGDGETIFGDFATAEETIKTALQLRKDSEEDEDLNGPDLSFSAAIFALPLFTQFDLHDAANIAEMATVTEAAEAVTDSATAPATDSAADPAIAAAEDVNETPKPSDLSDFAKKAIAGALVLSKKRKAEALDLTADSTPPPISKAPGLEAFVKEAISGALVRPGTKPLAEKPLATKSTAMGIPSAAAEPPSDESGPPTRKRQKTGKDK